MARDFSGSFSNRLTIGDVAELDITGTALSIHAWINADDVTTEQYFFSKHQRSGTAGYFLGVLSGAIQGHVGHNFHSDSSVSTSTWTGIGIRRNGTGASATHIFKDGVKGANKSDTNSIPNNTYSVTIGALHTDGPFNGRVAEVGIWDVALTDEEFASLGKGYAPPLIRPQSLKGYWPLYGNTSPEPDERFGNNATINGTVGAAVHTRIINPRETIILA